MQLPVSLVDHEGLLATLVRFGGAISRSRSKPSREIKIRIKGSRVEGRGKISHHSTLAPLSFCYFILMTSPLVPSCSRAP
jgi:hypothetical protein